MTTPIEEDFKEDELISLKLPRSQYLILKKIIEREEAWSWFESWIKGNLIWILSGGILTLFLLYDKIHMYFYGTVK